MKDSVEELQNPGKCEKPSWPECYLIRAIYRLCDHTREQEKNDKAVRKGAQIHIDKVDLQVQHQCGSQKVRNSHNVGEFGTFYERW